ncbi:patatin-like phospholipase family protein [Nakamurella sp. GG22]
MTTRKQTVHTAIVLQGGGALGAYEYGVLKALYETRDQFTPVAVTGISIGAVTAAVLGGSKGDPIDALDRLWRDKLTVSAVMPLPQLIDRSLAVLGDRGMYRLDRWQLMEKVLAPWNLTSIYDTGPLRTTLAELVDLEKLNGERPRVVVGATDVETAQIKFFDRTYAGGLTFEHVAASGSLPPGFPMTEIDGRHYWDGGLFSNTPLSPAIDALEDVDGGRREAIRELIVIELFPMNAPVPTNMVDVIERMIQLQYTSRLKLDKHFFDKVDRFVDLIETIEKTLPADSTIRNDPQYKQMLGYRKINHFNVVTSTIPFTLSAAGDFSRASIDARIKAGYEDAIKQGIGDVNSPGLRFDVTGSTDTAAAIDVQPPGTATAEH